MDCDLKQWRNQQHQSEQQQHSAKIPRLLLEPPSGSGSGPAAAALPLFVPEPICKSLSAFPDSITTSTSRFPGMGGGCLFSITQWQELEQQALIFKYMLAGAPLPAELLLPFKKSLLNTPACYLPYPYQQYQHYQPTMLQSGYWGRSLVDPEPGRCRRTDGKKWRCSRDIVLGQKYCERHVHRGRNRSRKPVEIPTPTAAGGDLKTALPLTTVAASGNHFALTGPSPSIDVTQLNQRSSESKPGNRGLFDIHNNRSGEDRSDGQLLRHFFDDWPRKHEESNILGSNNSPSTTCLSISTPGNRSDISLKLATGNGSESESQEERPQLNWGAAGWGTHHASSMGGPLAEALRSSTNSSSPTSVLHELRRGTASETGSLST